MLSKVPVTQLRIFEAAGRRSSLQAAAAELHLTPSAVSHAIRKMEQALGVVLFERSGRNLSLSAEGEALMRHVGPAFAELRQGIELVSTRGPQLLRLHSAPSFAAPRSHTTRSQAAGRPMPLPSRARSSPSSNAG